MDEEDRREILRKVAAGELTPQEAAYALEEHEQPAAAPVTATAAGDLRRLRIHATMGSLTVIGDEGVAEAVASGPHQARREGDSLVIETDPSAHFDGGFSFGAFMGFSRERVIVRANPRLELEVEAEAGSVTIEGMSGPIRGEVQAGSVRIVRFRSPLNLVVQAGSVSASGRLDAGESKISCQAGSVRIGLEAGSSVRVVARASLGRVSLPGGIRSASLSGSPAEAVVGSGDARLELEAELGSISVDAQ